MPPDKTSTLPDEPAETEHPYGERTGPRVIYDQITGYPVVTARPGAPLVTTEEIKKLLEDFP